MHLPEIELKIFKLQNYPHGYSIKNSKNKMLYKYSKKFLTWRTLLLLFFFFSTSKYLAIIFSELKDLAE